MGQGVGKKGATTTSLLWKMWVQQFAVREDERHCSAQSSARLQGPPRVLAHLAELLHGTAWVPTSVLGQKEEGRAGQPLMQCQVEFHSSGRAVLA